MAEDGEDAALLPGAAWVKIINYFCHGSLLI